MGAATTRRRATRPAPAGARGRAPPHAPQAQGKIKKKYGIDDERAALRAALAHWLDEGVGGKAFAGGEAPHFGDVCVYGALKSIDRTAAHKEIMSETAELAQWYQRMADAVGPSKGSYPVP